MRAKRPKLEHSESSNRDESSQSEYTTEHEQDPGADFGHEHIVPTAQEEVIVISDDSDDEVLSDPAVVSHEEGELAVCKYTEILRPLSRLVTHTQVSNAYINDRSRFINIFSKQINSLVNLLSRKYTVTRQTLDCILTTSDLFVCQSL